MPPAPHVSQKPYRERAFVRQKPKLSTYRKIPQLSAAEFDVISLLGYGGVGRVYLVRYTGPTHTDANIETNTVYALKVLTRTEMDRRKKQDRVVSEREILLASKHPFIMTLYASFEDERNYYLLMEYCPGGEFYRLLKRVGYLGEDVLKYYVSEIVSAFEYLHLHGIIYRDLKPENVLIHSSGHIRLTDFDLAKCLKVSNHADVFISLPNGYNKEAKQGLSRIRGVDLGFIGTGFSSTTNSLVGTPEYLAPEIIRGPEHSQGVDWWTLGVFTYEALFGKTPFVSTNRDTTFGRIVSGVFSFPSHPKVSKQCRDLISRLLDPNAKTRLGSSYGAAEIKSHPWFKGIPFSRVARDPPVQVSVSELDTSNFLKYGEEANLLAKDFIGTGADLPDSMPGLDEALDRAAVELTAQGMTLRPIPLNNARREGDAFGVPHVGTAVGGLASMDRTSITADKADPAGSSAGKASLEAAASASAPTSLHGEEGKGLQTMLASLSMHKGDGPNTNITSLMGTGSPMGTQHTRPQGSGGSSMGQTRLGILDGGAMFEPPSDSESEHSSEPEVLLVDGDQVIGTSGHCFQHVTEATEYSGTQSRAHSRHASVIGSVSASTSTASVPTKHSASHSRTGSS
ncbi:hypothetical protein KIPB_003486 [Kipferlia bialata]|uniref:non-specific serine/threonine protein kinase n=1 Tax=Kipferlia bialata TaxID=797122 RepID=A0A9K3GHA6_9EUKA|nr:hypothetical protein KIPB_003486 [Kipferlia bialata]|eukprot:g3486.t1